MKDVSVFLAAVFSDWVGRMSGGAGLLLTVWGLLVPTRSPEAAAFVLMGALVLVFATFRAWRLQYLRVEALQLELSPRLRIYCDAKPETYTYETGLASAPTLRHYRVKVVNQSAIPMAVARLVLEGSNIPDAPGVHPQHELLRTGSDDGERTFQLPAYGEVLVDVLRESLSNDKRMGLALCYARPLSSNISPNVAHTFTLRAEGEGPPCRVAVH